MRIDEVININIPITIDLDGEGKPKVSVAGKDATDDPNDTNGDLQDNPVMVPPQQQDLELAKAHVGKESPLITKLTSNQEVGDEEHHDHQLDAVMNLKTLAGVKDADEDEDDQR